MARHNPRHRLLALKRRSRQVPHRGPRALTAALATVGTAAAVVLFWFPAQAFGADAGITLTPATATTPSGAAVTYTLTLSCSATGGCTGTTVTFPTTGVTGNGSRTDFGSWLQSGTCPNIVTGGGVATVTFGNLPTGSQSCTFGVTPPEYLTLGGAQATITPTLNGSNFASVTGAAATLTVSAAHNAALGKSAPTNVASGGSFAYSLIFHCGVASYQGDVGLSAITTTDTLPANFTYVSYTAPAGLPGTFTYDAPTRTFTYADPTGAMCQTSQYDNGPNGANEVIIYLNGTASTGGIPDAEGETICNTASSSFTYLDGTTATSTSQQVCPSVTNLVPNPYLQKSSATSTAPNKGQYAPPSPAPAGTPYTFPGDWDGSGTSVSYGITLRTNSTSTGADFDVRDPLPCLSDRAGQVYSSPAPGAPYCSDPAVIPTLVTASGFPVVAADAITLIHTDGSTSTVSYTPGTGWIIPTSPTVAEIDFPRFAEEGANTATAMGLVVSGYASASAAVDSLLTNTATATAYQVAGPAPIAGPETASASVLVADPNDPSGTLLRPVIAAAYGSPGSCRETVGWAQYGGTTNTVEVASAPSKAIYLDFLAPAGGTITSGTSLPFTLLQVHSGGYYGLQQGSFPGSQLHTTAALDAQVTPNYHGTGRTLYEWVIPAGVITVPGDYQVYSSGMTVTLPGGCAGTYQNDMTMGYAGPVTSCYYGSLVYSNFAAVPPRNPDADGDLDGNGVGTGNYCGMSSPVTITPVNPGFSVAKTVQGNLDAAPVGAGGTGHVSPVGGRATYDVTFTNTGKSNLTDPVMYDLLPRIGDTRATSTTPRNSGFAVALTGLGPVPAGVTVSYSQASNPCRPEVLAANPGCTDDWSTTAPVPLSSVTALRFAYSGTVYVAGVGTSTFSVPFTVSTPSTSPGEVAWNSVGTSVFAGDTALPAAESSLTGLQAETAPTITKSASTSSYAATGDAITYTYTVTNNTAVVLSGVTVTDNLTDAAAGDTAPTATCRSLSAPAGACSGASTTLQPGQSATFTATYTVNQADLDHGGITDTATAGATPPTGGALANTSAPVTVVARQQPGLSMVKSADPSGGAAYQAGQTITYHYVVGNTGNVTLTGLAISEDTFTGSGTLSPVSCPATSLSPGAQMDCTATYTLTQQDIDSGLLTNTATVSGTAPSGAVVSAQSTVSTPQVAAPALALVSSADPATAGGAGTVITYRFTVTNTGNVRVDQIGIDDAQFSGTGTMGSISCPQPSLLPGEHETCTATYSVTQADVDAGAIVNTATATGTAPDASAVASPASQTTVSIPQAPALTLVKSADVTQVSSVGQRVTYSFTVTNTGNLTMHDLRIHEGTFTGSGVLSAVSCPLGVLAPAQRETCTATYQVTASDLAGRAITNTATATAVGPSAGDAATVESLASTATVAVAAPTPPPNPPAQGASSGPLAATGSDLRSPAGIAVLLLLAGLALVVICRRRA